MNMLINPLLGRGRGRLIFPCQFVEEQSVLVQVEDNRLPYILADLGLHRQVRIEHDVEPALHLLNACLDLIVCVGCIPYLGNVLLITSNLSFILLRSLKIDLDLVEARAGRRPKC